MSSSMVAGNADFLAPQVLTTLSFFRFGSAASRLWALLQMGLAPRQLRAVPGLLFWKMLGSGHQGGFGLRPSLSRYALLAVWASAADYERFITSPAGLARQRRATDIWTVELATLQAHGSWDGIRPFHAKPDIGYRPDAPLAILTRATIHWRHLPAFWKHVPAASRAMQQAPGLLFAAGIGELPVFRQATFSVWRDLTSMQDFAYGNAAHRAIIGKTRAAHWYREELFARFIPQVRQGAWSRHNPLSAMA